MKEELRLCNCDEQLCEHNTITIHRERKPLTYEVIEGNFKHLQGQILTLVEATMTGSQLEATKSIIKGYFNDKLTWMMELCLTSGEVDLPETPEYEE